MNQNLNGEEKEKLIEKIASNEPSPLKQVERINAYEKLSSESKWLVGIILDTPEEFIELLKDGRRKKPTTKSVKRFIESIWPNFSVQYVLSELRRWTNNF